jgi:GTPase
LSNEHRAGVCALIGRPNVGKSTLLNYILAFKVSIVSPRPQTTRNRIMGVYHADDVQVAFVDTPGIGGRDSDKALNRRMDSEARATLLGVDLAVVLIDPAHEADPAHNQGLLELLARERVPAVLAINKIDLLARKELLPVLGAYGQCQELSALVPISAHKGDGVEALLAEVRQRLPVSDPLFPPDMITDCSERFLCSEIIREKVFRRTGQEVPYATAVLVEQFEEVDDRRLIRIFARILVERDGQKGIVIGKRGAKLKEIGSAARLDMERLLGAKVFLELLVTVSPDWSRDPRAVQRLGHFTEE